ncbi:hypothetical protein [Parasphingorhabdus sp.]|uniref:hypothetical protein n=1 Tax=Parasphingorhabdus sp. TaxID=2709688 RepID=UPI00300213A8
MSVKNSLCLVVSLLALSACGSADADQSESPAIVTPATGDEAAAVEASPQSTVADDVAAVAVDEVAPTAKPAPIVAAKEKAPSGKKAKCKITSGGEVLKGPCLFESGEGGSFYVETDAIPGLRDQIDSISVTIIEKGAAEVRGLTKDGINSRWGAAQRSTTDKACWTGSDFEVCAY